MIMESSQIRVIYFPKYDESFTWPADGVDLQAYLDFNSEETTEKKVDGSNLPFLLKTFGSFNGVYNAGTRTYTVSGANWPVNQFRWHTLIDKNENRFRV
jgi:hypothetical protein